jgi:DNA-binding response OmpR family regulator
MSAMTPILSAWTRRSKLEDQFADTCRKRVLVVEDELMIGEVAAEALEEAGFAVFFAASAEEAAVILAHEAVDVLFTDINLGGRDGFDLANKALEAQPSLSVVFASGRSRRCHGNRVPADAAFLAKPYRLSDMISEVDRAVRGTAYQ